LKFFSIEEHRQGTTAPLDVHRRCVVCFVWRESDAHDVEITKHYE